MDSATIDRIIETIAPHENQHIVEIGPGRGALTDKLIRSGCQLEVIEIDRDLAAQLRTRWPDLNVIEADILKYNLDELGTNVRIVGNLPYNISTPLLFRLFSHLHQLRDMYFMLQREVVERMNASPSSSAYGRLSVMTQYYCQVEKLFLVPASAFSPKPKVMSAIIRLTPSNREHIAQDVKLLESLLSQAFSQRRKTIRNALRPFLNIDELRTLSLDPSARPENLTIDQFVDCANLASSKDLEY